MFTSPDTLVPDQYNPLDWNRYAYARYNPVKYSDPTGHAVSDGGPVGCGFTCHPTPSTPTTTSTSTSTPTTTDTPKPITDFIINQVPGSSRDWAIAGTVTDGVVLLMDLYADGVVVYATVVGIEAGLPVVVITEGVATPVPAVTGGAAFLVADFFLVQPILTVGNYGASAATVMTFVSETKSGATIIEKGQISTATKNSVALTIAGFLAPEAISSTLIQGACFANDLGWTSFPFH